MNRVNFWAIAGSVEIIISWFLLIHLLIYHDPVDFIGLPFALIGIWMVLKAKEELRALGQTR